MKLRYYLRGLGMGMIVTSLVLGLRSNAMATMSDAQVINRAKQLGMVESSSLMLSQLPEQSAEETMPGETVPEETIQQESMPEEVTSDETVPEVTSSEETISEDAVSEETISEGAMSETIESEAAVPQEDLADEGTTEEIPKPEESKEKNDVIYSDAPILLKIEEGSNSYSVSKDLAASGLVKSASDFDKYLCDNGLSKKIRCGTYEILPGTDEKDIARIITGK